ncbi:TAXI family TRAP transporter solute-binding subunit [Lactiplantibacillus plantarum]|uniref:TAXI family TRAP transporter solute-binding subunit n=1 Tax=Lactiplantibacillus plantarum TaxID=1590 RepID=UPI0040461D7A
MKIGSFSTSNMGLRDKLKDGGLDAFFFVGGAPAGAIAELASTGNIELVPLVGPEIDALRAKQEFFTPDVIAANTYQNLPEVKTISVWRASACRCRWRRRPGCRS